MADDRLWPGPGPTCGRLVGDRLRPARWQTWFARRLLPGRVAGGPTGGLLAEETATVGRGGNLDLGRCLLPAEWQMADPQLGTHPGQRGRDLERGRCGPGERHTRPAGRLFSAAIAGRAARCPQQEKRTGPGYGDGADLGGRLGPAHRPMALCSLG